MNDALGRETLICPEHQDYQVPLIGTLAFVKAERWCPYCGKAMGMFGDYKTVETTDELRIRHDSYRACYSAYLVAYGTFHARSVLFEGKRVEPADLPEEEIRRRTEVRDNGWFPKLKAEDLVAGLVAVAGAIAKNRVEA